MRSKSVVLQSQKKPQVLEKKFLPAYLRRHDLQNAMRRFFFKTNRSRDIQVWLILRFRKIAIHNKIIYKT